MNKILLLFFSLISATFAEAAGSINERGVSSCTDTTYISQGLCPDDSILFYGQWIQSVGVYDTLLTTGACDTFAILTISVVDPLGPHNVYDTICQGDSIWFNGAYLDTAGIYYAHYKVSAQSGCDSAVILNLAVNPAPVVMFTWDSLIAEGNVEEYYLNIGYTKDSARWCNFDPWTFVLMGNTPRGGTYAGGGISNDTFYGEQALRLVDILHSDYAIDTITYTFSNGNNCVKSVTGILFIYFCEGIQEISNQYSLQVYPNPANDYATVVYKGTTNNSEIEVLDMLGHVIKTQLVLDGITKTEIDLHALSNGLYFLRGLENGIMKGEGKPACPVATVRTQIFHSIAKWN